MIGVYRSVVEQHANRAAGNRGQLLAG
jgi:hypothetical protein